MVKTGYLVILLAIMLGSFTVEAKKPHWRSRKSQINITHQVPKPAKISYRHFLKDPKNKVSSQFNIHPELKPRVSFWYDIYTKYSSKDHVIHHTLHPWIVYEVLDTSWIYKKYNNKMVAHQKAEAFAKARKLKFRKILKKLLRLKNYNSLTREELNVFKKISYLGKNYKKILKVAVKNIRSQTGQSDFFGTGLVEQRKYLAHIEPILESKNVPIELASLPLVESSFNIHAKSKVGASGIWQIMPPTGRQYGIVNRLIDERNSPLKATLMAAKLLKFNNKMLKNWPLAITAYNHGFGNIRKSLRRSKFKNPYKFLNRYRGGAFGFASANFYASFLGALYASKYSKEIFSIQNQKNLAFDIIELKSGMTLRTLTKKTGLSLAHIKNLNLDLKKTVHLGTRLPKNFQIFLPYGAGRKISSNKIILLSSVKKSPLQPKWSQSPSS